MANFQRTKPYAYVKLGKRQKSMRKYRRATGRHNKTRQKWRSRPPRVEVGYKNQTNQRNIISGKIPMIVYNMENLKNAGKNNLIILGKMGAKSKIEIAREIINKNLETLNFNAKKFLKNTERKLKLKNKSRENKK